MNIRAVAEAGGGTLANIVHVNVFLGDWQYFSALNTIYAEFFSEPYPARTPILGAPPGVLIVADAVAILSDLEP